MKGVFQFITPLLAGLAAAGPILEKRAEPAPLRVAQSGSRTTGGYIVVLNDDANPQAHVNALGLGQRRVGGLGVDRVMNGVVKGYAGKFDDATLDKIRSNPKVAYIEPDILMQASNLQQASEYGLAISSQKTKIASYSSMSKYYYDPGAGSGVKVYVIDTGVYTGHNEFAPGRAKMVANFVPEAPNDDDQGHGTHCAGTIGGKTFGIAKNATINGIKVLDYEGWGATSTIISGINFAVRHCGGTKCVISMSLGGGYTEALNQAVDQAYLRGVPVIVAAGNDNKDACSYSPASAANAVTVGAIDWTYTKADFSNWGKCLDIFAPGYQITSSYWGAPDMEKTMSGTSMATPHVAGIAAYYLGFENLTPAQLTTKLINTSQKNLILKGNVGSPNRLANNGYFIKHPNAKY